MREPLAPGFGWALWRRVSRAIGLRREEALLLDRQYQLWLAQERLVFNRGEAQARLDRLAYRPLISLLMPVFDPGRAWLNAALTSVASQLYPHWELCAVDDHSTEPRVRRQLRRFARRDPRVRVSFTDRNEGICGASNRALAYAQGDFIGLLDHDDRLAPDALLEIVEALNQNRSLDFIYTDHDVVDKRGTHRGPFFKPDWSPDLLLCMNYITHFSVLRRTLVDQVGGFRSGFEGAEDFDLFLRITEASDHIAHVARPLYSWGQAPTSVAYRAEAKPYAHAAGRRAVQAALERRGIDGEVLDGLGAPFRYRVKRKIVGTPRVSIVVVTSGDRARLNRCLASVNVSRGGVDIEVVLCDIVEADEHFQRATVLNRAARKASGEHLVFMNDVVEAIQPGWLEALLEHSQRREVGAVGPKILASDGIIAHAGMILGVRGTAGPAFHGLPGNHPGYYDLARVIRNVSALTGACLMMRHDTFDALGGFDESLDADEDLDLCLRLRERGFLSVYTPYAVLRQQVFPQPTPSIDMQSRVANFGGRWGHLARDPYYSPHLTLQQFDFAMRIRRPPPNDRLRPQRLRFRKYFNGKGLELGPLHNPMPVDARRAAVSYVDHLTSDDQRLHYPELADFSFAKTHIVAEAERLPVADSSQDFVTANQLLQQLPDPIGAFIEWRRVLVPGGLLFMAIPDARKTADRSRSRTALADLLGDHVDGGASRRRSRYVAHAAATAPAEGIDAHEYAERLMTMRYGIPHHVWTPSDIRDFLNYMRDAHDQRWDVIRWLEPRQSDEFFVLLRK